MAGVLGIVPVTGADADTEPLALASLNGSTLLRRAVGTLLRSGAVDQVCVLGPSVWGFELAGDLALLRRERRRCVALELDDGEGWAAALPAVLDRHARTSDDLVVLHDLAHPLAPSALVRTVLDRLRADADSAAVVPAAHVTDTVKRLDAADNVTATVDREVYRTVCTPAAFRVGPLRAVLDHAAAAQRVEEVVGLPALLRATGAVVTAVPSPGEVFRVVETEDLGWVEALLTVGTDVDEEATDLR